MFEDDIMETSIVDSLTICDEEILESSYIEVVAPSRIDLGRSRFNNLVTPKKQSTVVPKLGSPMIEDVYSPQLKQELAVSNSDTKKRIEVIEISDAELSDADTLIRPDNDSYVEDMEAQSPFRQNITNNASSCDPNSSRFPLKQINTNKQDNGVKSLNHSILERNNVGSKDSIEYASDSMEVQGPFKSVTNPVTNKSKSGKSSNADESLLRAYRNILDERYSVEKLTPEEKGYDEFMLSFLSSLSDKTYGLPCHPGAVFFKRHFRRTKATLARHLYYIYNEHIFDNQLPKDMPIKWSKKLTSSCGITTTKVDINPETKTERHFAYITLSKKILTTAERLRDTVLHEMCHAAVWLINKSLDSHGPVWKLWAAKATICLPELPPIKRCHNYETNYKYLYKCRDCGYVIGRSRPSDKLLNRCACGYCGGRFREETTKLESTSFSG